jgi:hypothetical protein
VLHSSARWYSRFQKYRKMRKRVTSDPANKLYMDEALAPISMNAAEEHLVQLKADQIPLTYGAPVSKPHVAREAERAAAPVS